jgi:hypothetical protein
MAYGAYPELFSGMAMSAGLPESRRETCAEEFNQVKHAYAMLLAPHARAQAQRSGWTRPLAPADGGNTTR